MADVFLRPKSEGKLPVEIAMAIQTGALDLCLDMDVVFALTGADRQDFAFRITHTLNVVLKVIQKMFKSKFNRMRHIGML